MSRRAFFKLLDLSYPKGKKTLYDFVFGFSSIPPYILANSKHLTNIDQFYIL